MNILLSSPRRLTVAVLGAFATALIVGIPTAVVPTPLFGRALPVTWWSYPTLAIVAVLSGLLIATYGRDDSGSVADPDDPASSRGLIAGAISFFAVGCPVCNKIVLVLLGTSGAITWFAPLQPALALLSILGLTWALRTRLRGLQSCPVAQS
ncbi:MAG TPA: hypothetical protein P5108_07920 [Marmoricola sp.]|jgi:hypothetical protein|nr:hypothetical protein [Nocardioidaceae bacterium]HRV69363.1 hypothetical protein [Marmoricola sp.]